MFMPEMLIQDGKLLNYSGDSVDIVIPDGVEVIGAGVFKKKKIETVVLPDSVVAIEESAFEDCAQLRKVVLSKNLVEVGEKAFAYCLSLRTVDLPPTLKHLDFASFGGTKLEEIVIPASMSTISGSAFVDSPLKKIVVSEGCRCIEYAAFMYRGAVEERKIYLPSTLVDISYAAFDLSEGKNIIYSPVSPKIIAFALFSENTVWEPDFTNAKLISMLLEDFKDRNSASDSVTESLRGKIQKEKDWIAFNQKSIQDSKHRQAELSQKINTSTGLFKKSQIKKLGALLEEEIRKCGEWQGFIQESENMILCYEKKLAQAEQVPLNVKGEDLLCSLEHILEKIQPTVKKYREEYHAKKQKTTHYQPISVDLTPDVIDRINAAASAAVSGSLSPPPPDYIIIPHYDVSDM